IFDQLMVEQGLGAAFEQAFSQAFSMTGCWARLIGHAILLRKTSPSSRRLGTSRRTCNGAFVPLTERRRKQGVYSPMADRHDDTDGESPPPVHLVRRQTFGRTARIVLLAAL